MLNDPWAQNTLAEMASAPDDAPLHPSPSNMTEAAQRFFHRSIRLFGVIIHLYRVSVFADNASHVAGMIAGQKSDLPLGFDPFTVLPGAGGPFLAESKRFKKEVFEMIFSKISECLTNYSASIISECLRARPEILRSGEVVSLDFVLSFKDMNALRDALIERKIRELSYQGFDKLNRWIKEKLGIAEHLELGCMNTLLEAVEIRNCLVHNDSKFSEKYEREFGPIAKRKAGEDINIDVEHHGLLLRSAGEYVAKLDELTSKKFLLTRRSSH